jgi:hypothetical protein
VALAAREAEGDVVKKRPTALEPGVLVELIGDYEGLKMVVVEASNGRFRGHAEAYVGAGEMERIAAVLDGFPTQPSDERNVLIGSFDRDSTLGGARLRFFCRETHVIVEMELASRSRYPENARFFVECSPSTVEAFVKELRAVGERYEVPARLRC